MPTDDTIRKAVSMVRHYSKGIPDTPAAILTLVAYNVACELLACLFVENAGELSRLLDHLGSLEVTQTEISQDSKYGNRAIFQKGEGKIYVQDVLAARRLAATLAETALSSN